MQLMWLPLVCLASFAALSKVDGVNRDVYFLLDSSGSIGLATWKRKVIPFVQKMLNLTEDEVKCGRNEVRKNIFIEFSHTAVVKTFDKLAYVGKSTSIGTAMMLAAFEMNKNDKNNENVCVIITDGGTGGQLHRNTLKEGIKRLLTNCACVIGIATGKVNRLESFSRRYELYDVLVSLDDCPNCDNDINELICNCGKSCDDVEDIAGTSEHLEKSTRNKRVINNGKLGVKAEQYQFPYMVGLGLKTSVWCGAAIISCKHMLTSASCVRHVKNSFALYFGNPRYRTGIKRTGQLVSKNGYDSSKPLEGNDIALVTLENPIKVWSKGIRPIRLPSVNISPENEKLKTMGWGSKKPNAIRRSDELRYTESLNGLTKRNCDIKLKGDFPLLKIGTDIICAESTTKGYSGMGWNDNGGPLVIEKDGFSFLLGLNTKTKYNGYYAATSVFPYINWQPLKKAIEDNIKKSKE